VIFEIQTHQGAGPIRFGMTPDEVRTILGVKFKSFKRAPDSEYPCDHFFGLECFVYYSGNGRTEAVEFVTPAEPLLNGTNLLTLGFSDLVTYISKIDPQVSIENDGFTSENLGVGAWAPNADDEPELPAETIIVFVPGYYDETTRA
jgi:hypothetical protein